MGAATSRFGPCWPRRRRSPQDEPYLTDDVLEEVFLRLPPHPDCLRRVSLVSRRFRRVVTGRRFLARVRGIRGVAPQLVGLFHNHNHGDDRFVPVGVDGSGYFRRRAGPVGRPPRGPLSPGDAQWNILGCRGGRVLLLSPDRLRLLVLEPMRGRRQYFPAPPAPVYKPSCFSNAAVVTADSGHDELSSHLFRVVFVSCNAASKRSTVFIYNSAAFRWTKVATAEMSSVVDGRPSVLIGQVLYWHLVSHGIISFNLETHELHEILVPADAFDDVHEASLNIVVPKGGGVGLAAVSGYILQMWTLRNFTHGASTWDLRKIVRLDALLPLRNARFAAPPPTPTAKHPLVWMMALDEDKNVGYIWTMVGVFAVQLDSMKYHKVIGAVCRGMDLVYPYKTFFLPAGT
uniref:F-box domain-containing protein n=1 Tax=Oryza brachyantha TaxID=4533 RepID=J3N0U1_ORYBR